MTLNEKIFTDPLLIFILGAVIFGGIGTIYALVVTASDITYDTTKSGSNKTNIQDVIDELYSRANQNSFCKRITGNNTTIGSKYECDPGDGIYRIFYVLKVNDDTTQLIMDRNINRGTLNWETAMEYFTSGAGSNLGWTNVLKVDNPDVQDIANAVGNTSWDVNSATINNWFYFDKYNGVYQNSVQVANQNNISEYYWLFSNVRECYKFGCSPNASLDSSAAYAYWTKNKISNDNTRAWVIVPSASIYYHVLTRSTDDGVRPVITVSNNKL